MPIYHYSRDDILDQVEIITNLTGGARAYLHARSDAAPETLAHIAVALQQHGWVGIPYTRDGAQVLEVRGFDKPARLQQALATGGWAKTATAHTQTKDDHRSLMDKFRSATLRWSGIAYIFGDAAFMTYAGMEYHKNHGDLRKAKDGLKGLLSTEEKLRLTKAVASAEEGLQGGRLKIGAGIFYALGSIVLTWFGSKDQSEIEIKNAARKIDGFVRGEGFAKDTTGAVLTQEPNESKNASFLQRANHLLRRFPSESLNILYTGVGFLLMGAAFKARNAPQKFHETPHDFRKRVNEETLDIGLGVVTAVSAITGLAVKEKKPIKGEEKRTGLAGVWDWIQEKPLRATGYGYMLATLIHGGVTASKWKWGKNLSPDDLKNNRILSGRVAFIGMNILAEALMVISSKGHGEGVKAADVDHSVIAAAAEFVSKQEPGVRESLIDRLSGYMASPDVLGGSAETIAKNVREQLAGMEQNPWTKATRPMPRISSGQSEGMVQSHQQLGVANA